MSPGLIIAFAFLFLIVLCIALLSIRVSVRATYEKELSVALNWLWIKKQLLPPDKHKKKPKKEKEDEEKPKKEKGKNPLITFYKNQGFEGVIKLIVDVSKILDKLIKGLLKHVLIENLSIKIVVAKPDANETAVEYGKICAEVFPALGAICSYCKVKKYNIDINPDFMSGISKASFNVAFSIAPIIVLNLLIVALFRALNKVVLKLLKSENKNKIEGKDEDHERTIS